MVVQVKRVTILGAGQMGSGAAAVFGQEVPVYLLNRAPISKAQAGLQAALNMARSNSLNFSISPGTYEDDLERCVRESYLILDTLGEDVPLNVRYFKLVDHRGCRWTRWD